MLRYNAQHGHLFVDHEALHDPSPDGKAALIAFLGVTLVTNNTREFGKIRNLAIENWADDSNSGA
jgi:hypothetical protein